MIYQQIDLNMIPGGVAPILNVSQYDASTRTFQFTLYENGELFEIPSGASVNLRGKKPDGNAFSYACSYSGSVASIVCTQQMTAVAGKVICEVRVTSGSTVVGSGNFILMVEKAPYQSSEIPSKSYIDILETASNLAVKTANLSGTPSASASSLTWTKLGDVTITEGKHLIIVHGVATSSNSTGHRAVGVGLNLAPPTSAMTCLVSAPPVGNVATMHMAHYLKSNSAGTIGIYASSGQSSVTFNVNVQVIDIL